LYEGGVAFELTRSVTKLEMVNFSEAPKDKVSHYQMSLAVCSGNVVGGCIISYVGAEKTSFLSTTTHDAFDPGPLPFSSNIPLHRSAMDCMGLYGAVWGCPGLHGAIWGCMELNGAA